MKLFNFSTLACGAAILAALTGCSDADMLQPEGDGHVSFAVSLPGGMTRSAFDNGSAAKDLQCLVFRQTGDKTYEHLQTVKVEKAFNSSLTGHIDVTLAKGVDYKLLFWADAGKDSPYTITENGELIITGTPGDNSVNQDAFCSVIEFKGGPTEASTTLTRPFAQLNIGTDDLNEPVVQHSYPDGVYAQVAYDLYLGKNLLTGDMIANPNNPSQEEPFRGNCTLTPRCDVKYLDGIDFPKDPLKYHYTNMVYVLVPEDGMTCTVDYVFANSYIEAVDATYRQPIHSVPLKKNYQTNIYGSLLTSETDFNVEISPMYSGQTAESVADILKIINTTTGDQSFIVTEDISKSELRIPSSPTLREITIQVIGNPLPEVVEVGENIILNLIGDDGEGEGDVEYAAPRRRVVSSDPTQCKYFAKSGGTLRFRSGTFTKPVNKQYIFGKHEKGNIEIYGGKFNGQDPSEFVVPECDVYKSGANSWTVYSGAVAFDVASLEKAVAKANNRDNTEIHIVKSFAYPCAANELTFTGTNTHVIFEKDAYITRDLPTAEGPGVKWLTYENKTDKYLIPSNYVFAIAPSATVKMSGEGGMHACTKMVAVDGTLTVDGGNYVTTFAPDLTAVWVGDAGRFVLNGGTWHVANRLTTVGDELSYNDGGVFVMNGGNVTSTSEVGYAVTVHSSLSHIVFNGGKITANFGCMDLSAGSWVINGGEFSINSNHDGDSYYVLFCDTYEHRNHPVGSINGGKFYSQNTETLYLSDEPTDVVLKGGEFSNKGYDGLYGGHGIACTPAEGYTWVATGNATYPWKVVAASPAAAKRRK